MYCYRCVAFLCPPPRPLVPCHLLRVCVVLVYWPTSHRAVTQEVQSTSVSWTITSDCHNTSSHLLLNMPASVSCVFVCVLDRWMMYYVKQSDPSNGLFSPHHPQQQHCHQNTHTCAGSIDSLAVIELWRGSALTTSVTHPGERWRVSERVTRTAARREGVCGSESGGGSLVLRLSSESIHVSGAMQRGRLGGICCPSFQCPHMNV